MMHKVWSCIEEAPYCFSGSFVKFQGHAGQKIADFNPNLVFPDYNFILISQMAMKWCSQLDIDHKFITGIYHKVDDFNFEVISYPFPQSNVHSMLGYSTYYSQLIRFFKLCNNNNDFLFRAKFSYSKLVKRGYKHNLLLKYFKKFCSAYNIEGKHGEKNSDLLFYA